MSNQIPLVDLGWQHAEIADELAAGFDQVMRTTAFTGGPAVREFEAAYSQFVGSRHCVGVANGTDAIELALRAIGVGANDEVILPANTFVATAEAVVRAGGKPVLTDVDPVCLLIDPDAVAAAITERTRAIVPVHLYGQTAPVEQLDKLASDAGIRIVEDAAQSQGALRHGVSAGHLGLAAATSFYPGKNLGAYGDAGAVTTDDDAVAAKIRALGNHGSTEKYHHPALGFNSRLDTLQAVVLNAKLRRLERWNKLRSDAAYRYSELLSSVDGVQPPQIMAGNDHVWHLYVVRVQQRDDVLKELNADGIGAGVHYPIPVHRHGAFAYLGYPDGSFPVSEAAADEILSLPLYPGISVEQQERVVERLALAVGSA